MNLGTPLKVVNTIFSSYKSEEYARLITETVDEIDELLSNKECNQKLAELVKQVKPEDLDKCPGIDKIISLTNEINEYVFNKMEEGQKCYEEKQSITECFEEYLPPLMNKSTTYYYYNKSW